MYAQKRLEANRLLTSHRSLIVGYASPLQHAYCSALGLAAVRETLIRSERRKRQLSSVVAVRSCWLLPFSLLLTHFGVRVLPGRMPEERAALAAVGRDPSPSEASKGGPHQCRLWEQA